MGSDRLQHRGTVCHVLSQRSDLIQRGTISDQSVTGDRSVSRFHTDHPAIGCWLSDGTAGIGAQCRKTFLRCYCRRGTAGRTSGNMLRVSRISRHTVIGSLCGTSHSELIHVGLAQDDCTGFFQIQHCFRTEGRNKILQNFRRAGGQGSLGTHIVFDSERDTGQGACQFSRFDFLLYFRCLFQSLFPFHGHIAVVGILTGCDLIQNGLRRFHRRSLTFPDRLRQLYCCQG